VYPVFCKSDTPKDIVLFPSIAQAKEKVQNIILYLGSRGRSNAGAMLRRDAIALNA
jgi:hypothetical protein